METLDDLKKTLEISKSIGQVVNTMKSLSSVNIKKHEKHVKILYAYKTSIELGLQAIINNTDEIKIDELQYVKMSDNSTNLSIIFGSNQGLCGRFNDKILDFLIEDIKKNNLQTRIIVVGNRLNMMASNNKNLNIVKSIIFPNLTNNLSNTIYEILNTIDNEILSNNIGKVFLYYTANDETVHGSLTKDILIPVNIKLFKNLKNKVWITNNIPYWQIDTKTLILDLLRQYIFLSINNALINSIASEQKNRLITLQNAEKNINDLMKTKTLQYNQKRQNIITSELIDIVTGYNVVKK